MKLTKTAKGLSDQLAPVLGGVLDAIYRVTDEHKARQLGEQLKLVVRLAIKANEAGLDQQQFNLLLSAVNIHQATVANGRVEFTAAVSSGMEEAGGSSFHVGLTTGGVISGFGIDAEAGYEQDKRSSMYERSSQNLRVRLDFTSAPMEKFDALVDAMAARVFAVGTEAPMAELSEPERSPLLDALESYLPVIKKAFNVPAEDE